MAEALGPRLVAGKEVRTLDVASRTLNDEIEADVVVNRIFPDLAEIPPQRHLRNMTLQCKLRQRQFLVQVRLDIPFAVFDDPLSLVVIGHCLTSFLNYTARLTKRLFNTGR